MNIYSAICLFESWTIEVKAKMCKINLNILIFELRADLSEEGVTFQLRKNLRDERRDIFLSSVGVSGDPGLQHKGEEIIN